jgi:hypothetical protein
MLLDVVWKTSVREIEFKTTPTSMPDGRVFLLFEIGQRPERARWRRMPNFSPDDASVHLPMPLTSTMPVRLVCRFSAQSKNKKTIVLYKKHPKENISKCCATVHLLSLRTIHLPNAYACHLGTIVPGGTHGFWKDSLRDHSLDSIKRILQCRPTE